jgi:hypothetical protein
MQRTRLYNQLLYQRDWRGIKHFYNLGVILNYADLRVSLIFASSVVYADLRVSLISESLVSYADLRFSLKPKLFAVYADLIVRT